MVDAANIILYVLDARDPEGTRSRIVERQIMGADGSVKRLILILNKIYLVQERLKGWLDYLCRYFPTLPLKASRSAANVQTFDQCYVEFILFYFFGLGCGGGKRWIGELGMNSINWLRGVKELCTIFPTRPGEGIPGLLF